MGRSDTRQSQAHGLGHSHGGSHGGHAGHGHHHHAPAADGARHEQRLLWTLGLAAAYMLAEALGGYLTGSLALIADAGHMLSDVAALGLSVFAIRIARRPPTLTRTYGHHRTEILAALANGATLVAISIYVVVEACRRFAAPPTVNAPVMMAVAAGGLLFNVVGLHLLAGGRDSNLNVRGAWLHVATDALGSLQTVVAGALIWGLGWRWADPAASGSTICTCGRSPAAARRCRLTWWSASRTRAARHWSTCAVRSPPVSGSGTSPCSSNRTNAATAAAEAPRTAHHPTPEDDRNPIDHGNAASPAVGGP
jgi:hypothetical protein